MHVRRQMATVSALAAFALLLCGAPPVRANLVITPSFTTNFTTDFGVNAVAAENAWIAAANVYTSTFTANPGTVNINITVDAVTGTSVFGRSNEFLDSFSYGTLRNAVVSNASSAAQLASVGPGGSVAATDPTGGSATWWVTTAQAKALGLIANNLSTDGTTTFGAGNPFTFSGPITAGTYDFQGVAAHEIAEVMGRLGLKGGTVGGHANSYSLVDLFSYTGPAPGTRSLAGGTNDFFSIDNGTTLLKQYNDWTSNGLDSRDWASGTNDAYNQFSNSGVINPVSAVDIEEMNVLGYDLPPQAIVPEPATFGIAILGGALGLGYGWRRRHQAATAL